MPEFPVILPIIKSIWNDPVWSKVIATGIIALLGGTAGTWILNDQKTKWPIIGMIIFGIGFIGCAAWYWYLNNTLPSTSSTESGQSSPDKPPSPPSLTLEYFFERDSPLGSFERRYDLSVKDSTTNLDTIVTLRVRLLYDFTSHSEFLSVYIPRLNDVRLKPYDFMASLRDRLIEEREKMHASVVMGQAQPGIPYSESSELIFSGRVFIYTTNLLNPVQIGDLVRWYQQSGLYLEIRGVDYLTFRRSTAK
jgi:hypothetical protein